MFYCQTVTVGSVLLQVSDRQSYLVVSLVLCLFLGLVLCLQCCRSSSPSPKTSAAALPKSNHYPSPKRFVTHTHMHILPHMNTSRMFCLCRLFVSFNLLAQQRHSSPASTCRKLECLHCTHDLINVNIFYFLIRCFSSYDDMSLKRRVTCPLVRSKSFHLCSTEGKSPLLDTRTRAQTPWRLSCVSNYWASLFVT